MSIGCTEMARKVRKKHNEQIGAKTTKKWKKIAKTNLPLSGEIKIKMASSSSPVEKCNENRYCVVGH